MSTHEAGKAIAPALVLGLDGACFEILDPLIDAGRLPNQARWRAEGSSTRLRSTVPPMSFPAWSTFLTGLSPGRHGLFDFTQKAEGAYRLRFANASDRLGAAFFSRVSQAGGRSLVLGVPGTFPPNPSAVCSFRGSMRLFRRAPTPALRVILSATSGPPTGSGPG
jgi:predicted AlkP superfamily phosphohydrolase/phosphomutase